MRFTGTLYLVVGPSGAGKDSLIRAARSKLDGNPDYAFPARAITRPPQPGEGHRHISGPAFEAEEAAGAFALTWRAHGFAYGITRDVEADLAAGRAVIVNVSRTVIGEAREKFPNVTVVFVNAPNQALAERLAGRGRENAEQARERLSRARAYSVEGPGVIELINDGTLEAAIEKFIDILRGDT
ncbi:MAG: phosphonate metabolism protein/1,5-bisphosphokinase (PRPP-forming) PhnN [Rhodospirillales bacterium]